VESQLTELRGIYYGFKSKKWPTTQAKISNSTITVEKGWETENVAYRVEYEYHVGGETFTNRTVSFESEVQKHIPEGFEVPVYYHPKNPKLSVLEPGYQFLPKSVTKLVLWTFFFVLLIWGLFQFISP
jgi:hypothetical protein